MLKSDDALKKLQKELNDISELSKKACEEINKILKEEHCEKESEKIVKTLVDSLVTNATSVKDGYSGWLESKSLSSSSPLANGIISTNQDKLDTAESSVQEKNEESILPTSDETQQNGVSDNQSIDTKSKVPMLKIVDFSKLVDPKNLELMDKNHKQKSNNDASIIILSSSDDESVQQTKHKNQPSKISKSNSFNRSTDKSKSRRYRFNSGEKRLLSTHKNDIRLRGEAYVKVLRVPCEDMENYYLNKTTTKSGPILDEKTGEILIYPSDNDESSKRNKKSRKNKQIKHKIRSENVEKTSDESSPPEDLPLKRITKLKDTSKKNEESPTDETKTNKCRHETQDKTSSKSKNLKKPGAEKSNKKDENAKLSDDESTDKCEEDKKSKSKLLRSRLSLGKSDTHSDSSSSDEEFSKSRKRITSRRKKDEKLKEKFSEYKRIGQEKKKKVNEKQKVSDEESSGSEGMKKDEQVNEGESSSEGENKNEKKSDDTEKQLDTTTDTIQVLDVDPSKKLEENSKGVSEENESEALEETDNDENNGEKDKSIETDKPDEDESRAKSTSPKVTSDEDMFDESSPERLKAAQKEKEVNSKKPNPDLYVLSEDENEPKGGDNTSFDSDVGNWKRKTTKTLTTKDVIEINSDDSESDESDDIASLAKPNIRKRKLKNSDSEEEIQEDNSSGHKSASDSDKSKKDDEAKSTTKRRRIQEVDSDSDLETRKKIKKVISSKSLSDQTKKAGAEERERKQRILEKQKKYNQIYENLETASSKVEKLILDVDEKTEKPLLEVDKTLVSKLKPHQASGIQFMWDACFESLERSKSSEGSGCILAHCMGLGKTLQVIALANTLLEAHQKTKVRKILIVTPLSTVLNWKAEFKNWLSGDEDYEVFELVSCKPQNAERAMYIRQWNDNGGVMIISYAMFRNLSNEKNRKVSKKIRTTFYEGLVDPGPDLVICDEGHLLKNEKTSLSVAMNRIKTKRRIVLTGTPLQNNLKEYYCMVHFVKPSLLGTYKEYLNRFVNPITNGQYTDSTQYDINVMRRRSHVLHKLLEGIVQRRDYSVLSPYLPPKFEYVLFLTLTETQKKLYDHYLQNFARKSKDESSNRASYLFQDFQALSRICIHPRVLLDKSVEDQQKYQSEDEESAGSLKDFIAESSEPDSSTSDSSESESDSSTNSNKKKKKKKKGATKRVTRAQKASRQSDSEPEEEEVSKEWWQEYCDGDELENIANSTKILVLFEILKECEQIGDKVLVFSQSLYALNVIEYFLAKVDEATQNGETSEKTCGYSGSWAPGLDYFRLDGSTNCSLRSNWCDSFNKESNSRARLFLLSTRAGGLGINLVAANRVIIFDVSWNPSSDLQSIYRVYRFGQLKPSYIYRFVIYGTMEMKIYERQVTKQAISKRVIDEQQIDRHYNQNDLAELYKFDKPTLDERPIPLVPKDVLLGELLQHHEEKIFKYHEHQSLLENKEDETLNEEERKAAWDEFENEKVERTKQTLIGKFSISTVQLALKSIIQKDNPTWNNNQIVSIIPQLIQNLNFQLGQGDNTMYNRIAAEVKFLQDEYARKMQMQFLHHRMQMEAQRQQFGMFPGAPRVPNPFFGQMAQFWANTPGSSRINPNEVLELN